MTDDLSDPIKAAQLPEVKKIADAMLHNANMLIYGENLPEDFRTAESLGGPSVIRKMFSAIAIEIYRERMP